MKHRKLLSTLLAASMTISVVGNIAPAVFADTIEDSEEIVVTDETSAEDENEEISEEIIEETEAIEETGSEIEVEETEVQEDEEEEEAIEEDIEEADSEEIEETEVTEETISESEIAEDKIDEKEPEVEENETPAAVEEEEKELPLFNEETTVNGILITVKADRGVFPVGSYVVATPVNDAQAEALVSESRDENVNVAYTMTFDITVYNAEGIEIEPDTSKGSVYVSFKDTRVADNNLDVDVYHITDNKAVELTSEVDDDTVVAVTDSFSYYTVEFTYDSLEYVLDGDSTVALSVILDTVGLEGSVSSVEVSNENLFYAYNESGVWYVRANQAFNTEEWMKVTIAGTEYVIVVTDDNNVTVECVLTSKGFDIRSISPKFGTTWSDGGYATYMKVNESGNKIRLGEDSSFDFGQNYGYNNVSCNLTKSIVGGNAVVITYTVTNNNEDATVVYIGSAADTDVDGRDDCLVEFTVNGIRMENTSSHREFFLIPGNGDFTTRWTGNYSSDTYSNHVFDNGNNYRSGDSAFCYSWRIIVPAGGTVVKTAIFAAGASLSTNTVTFNSNASDATGSMNEAKFVSGIPGSLPENAYSRTGYTFMGWAESDGSTTVTYPDQGQITLNSNRTLYAVWLQSAVVDEVPTAPTAEANLVYNGQPQVLLATPGSSTTGTMVYSIDSVTWSTELPTRTNAGTYTVYYKAQGDGVEYGDSAPERLTVTISKAPTPTLTDLNKPTALEQDYTGSELPLVVAPQEVPAGYTIKYRVNNMTWMTAIPTQKNAGTYQISVKYVDEGENYESDIPGDTLTAIIRKIPAPTTLADNELPTINENLVYTGNPQQLINAPEKKPDGYNKVEYSTDGIHWSTNLPTGTNAGDYEVYVRYTDTNDNHEPFTRGPFTVNIATIPGPTEITETQRPTSRGDQVYTGNPIQLVDGPTNRPDGYEVEYSTDGGETWTNTPPTGTNKGDYEILVRYRDPNENHVPSIINGTPIEVSIAPAPGPEPEEIPDTQRPTPRENQVFTGNPIQLVNEPTERPDGYEVEYSVDGGETWTNTPPTGENAGNYEILVRYRDPNGNHDPSIIPGTPVHVTIDPIPAFDPETLTDDQKPTGNDGQEYTGNPIALVNDPIDKPEGFDEVEYSTDGGRTWTSTPPMGENAGEYEILVRYRDTHNNHVPNTVAGEPITVTIVPKAAPEIDTLDKNQKPTGIEDRPYTAMPVDIINENTDLPANYDKVLYSIDGGKTWTHAIPETEAAGKIVVNVKYVDSEGNHEDIKGEDIVVNIVMPKNPTRFGYDFEGWYGDEEFETPFDPETLDGNETSLAYARWEAVEYTLIEGNDLTVGGENGENARFRAVRNRNETTTFSHHTYVQLDDELLNEDNYTKKSGSVIIELNPEYVATLAPGVHTIEIFFDDSYSVKTTFVVEAPAASAVPSTGEMIDYPMIVMAVALIATGCICTGMFFAIKKKEEEQ